MSIVDHASAVGVGKIVYGENSFGGTHASAVLPVHGGADVYIRNSASVSPSAVFDGDGDGTPDDVDDCPSDPNKIQPGKNGE